jgi:hypothetical protein
MGCSTRDQQTFDDALWVLREPKVQASFPCEAVQPFIQFPLANVKVQAKNAEHPEDAVVGAKTISHTPAARRIAGATMVRKSLVSFLCAFCLVGIGCCHLADSDNGASFPDTSHNTAALVEMEHGTQKKGPKTIFEWAIGGKDKAGEKDKEEQESKNDGKDKASDNVNKDGERAKDGEDGDGHNNAAKKGKEGSNGHSKENGNDKEKEEDKEPEPEKRLATDRPHFPEASSTVGKGRVILESGYTFTTDHDNGTTVQLHSYPEALLRIGLFADWFELRIAQDFATRRINGSELATTQANSQAVVRPGSPGAATIGGEGSGTESGAEDLTLGVKLALTEQKKYLPESAIILQMRVPSGASAFSAHEVLPGVNYDFSWELVKDCLSLEGVVSANGDVDDVGHSFVRVASGLTGVYSLTPQLEAFAEWFAFYPAGAIGPDTGPQHYAGGGLVYFITNNFLIDIRATCGLNDHADDFLAGAGFGLRY